MSARGTQTLTLFMAAAPRIALTGASSCTGHWIAYALHAEGFAVHALCSRRADRYSGRRQILLRSLAGLLSLHFDLDACGDALPRWVLRHRPEIWIHHHHLMRGFRSPGYDLEKARKVAIAPLEGLLDALAETRCRGVIFSGSYFEPGEGGPEAPRTRTPYAHSKAETWEALRRGCEARGLPLSKIVIPNATGPLESPERLVPALVRASRASRPFVVASPASVTDALPAQELGRVYAEAAHGLLAGHAGVFRPSGLPVPVGSWARTVLRELVGPRLGLRPCPLTEDPASVAPVQRYSNPRAERRPIQWLSFWDEYAAWLRRHPRAV